MPREILSAWSRWLPPAVAGSLPGRSASDVAYCVQCVIEDALLHGKPLAGFSLDISKAFNQLPRSPVAALLVHLGAPADLVGAWMEALRVAERCPILGGGIGVPMPATTGAPEKETMAVVAMAAVCSWILSLDIH